MATAASVGTAGRVVAHNVKRFRIAAGLSLRDLEALLRQAGRPIHLAGLFRIEKGERRVDIDELAALALLLGVTPTRLLVPDAAEDRLSTGDVERHREGLDVAAAAVRAVVDDGLPLRGVLDHVEMVLTLDALKGRPDLQDMYLRAFEVGDKVSLLPLELQHRDVREAYARRHGERVAQLAARVAAGDPSVQYDPGTGPGTDRYTVTPQHREPSDGDGP